MVRLGQNSVWFYNQRTRQLVPQEKLRVPKTETSSNDIHFQFIDIVNIKTLRAM
jgi:hypothetical protein